LATSPQDTIGAARPGAAFASLLGDLSREILQALTELALRLHTAAIVFDILFIPWNRGTAVEGTVAGAPELSYRYDRDTGVLQLWQHAQSGPPTSLGEFHVGVDGRFYDNSGNAVGRPLPDGSVIVDTNVLQAHLSGTGESGNAAHVEALGDTNQPKLCPDPTPDRPGAPLDNPYQRYVSMLVNGQTLPPGLAVSLFNPLSGKDVVFDDCRLSDGTMIEAKGGGYLEMLQKGSNGMQWLGVQDKLLGQANGQLQAAQGRPIEWYFKAQPVAEYVRELFSHHDLGITVIYAPQPE
jgi:hypothetical protein